MGHFSMEKSLNPGSALGGNQQPLFLILVGSVHNPEVRASMPLTSVALGNWDGGEVPDSSVFEALASDLTGPVTAHMPAVNALNLRKAGFRSLLMNTQRAVEESKTPLGRDDIIAVDRRWENISYWKVLQSATRTFTANNLLATVDIAIDEDGQFTKLDNKRAVYLSVLLRTIWIAGVVLVACVLIGYPIAYVIAHASASRAKILLPLVLIPLWTSLLARTTAWLLIFQKDGIGNQLLVALGIFEAPQQLLYTRGAVYVAMVYIMLPFMVLPAYANMKSIGIEQVRAAKSLGASPAAAFLKVYFPQTFPGLFAGMVLVFVVSLGFYITPMLIGGGTDTMVSNVIANLTVITPNWPMASSLAVVLLIGVVTLIGIMRLLVSTTNGRS